MIIFRKYLLYAIFNAGLTLFCGDCFAQSFKPRVYVKEATNYSTLYSNYLKNSFANKGGEYDFTLADEEIYDQLAKQIPPDKLDYVIAYSQRQNYPPDMQRTDWVDAKNIQQYAILYYMARFSHGTSKFILIEFPAAENAQNQGLKEEQRPKTDIYFVIDDRLLKDEDHFLKDSIAGNMYNTKGWYGEYTKSEKKIRENLIKNFDAFYNNTEKYIDTSFYFKTIVPVPHFTREQYITHQITTSAGDNLKMALLKEQEKLTTELIQTEKKIVELYKQNKYAELLTAFPIWECESISLDTTKERSKGDLRGPVPMLMSIRVKMQFTKGDNGVDLLTDEIISAQEDYGSQKAEEYFTTVQHFSIEPGNPTLKNGVYKNNRAMYSKNFDSPPYDFFKPLVTGLMNEFVVPSFTIQIRSESAIFLVFQTEHLRKIEFYPEVVSALNSRLKTINKQLDRMK